MYYIPCCGHGWELVYHLVRKTVCYLYLYLLNTGEVDVVNWSVRV